MANTKIIEKYSYFDISKPNQSLNSKVNSCNNIFFNKFFYSSFISDCINYSEKLIEIPSNKRDKIRKYYRAYKFGDYAILGLLCYRLFYHFKKGYFKTNSRFLDLYICSKLTFYLISLYYIKFFIFKSSVDQFLYEYFSVKEYNVALSLEQKSLERKSKKE